MGLKFWRRSFLYLFLLSFARSIIKVPPICFLLSINELVLDLSFVSVSVVPFLLVLLCLIPYCRTYLFFSHSARIKINHTLSSKLGTSTNNVLASDSAVQALAKNFACFSKSSAADGREVGFFCKQSYTKSLNDLSHLPSSFSRGGSELIIIFITFACLEGGKEIPSWDSSRNKGLCLQRVQ